MNPPHWLGFNSICFASSRRRRRRRKSGEGGELGTCPPQWQPKLPVSFHLVVNTTHTTHTPHTQTDKSLCQRDSNNPNKAKRLNSWSCFIWFQPQIHFSRRRFAVGCCCCERGALSAALAVNQIRWWFSACLWLQSHFPLLVPRSSFPIFHFSPNCTDATPQLEPKLRQRNRLRLRLRLRLTQASKVAQSFRPLHSVARALKNCQHSICVQSNVATNYEIYHKWIELHCSIITTFWYLLDDLEIWNQSKEELLTSLILFMTFNYGAIFNVRSVYKFTITYHLPNTYLTGRRRHFSLEMLLFVRMNTFNSETIQTIAAKFGYNLP